MRRLAWLLLVPLILAADATSGDLRSLARRAEEAFDAGRMARAAELYELAGVRTREPARAAYNLATARYHQARDGQLSALGEAEVNYRACLGHGEYRARALCGLANCLLLRAESASTLDRATLKAAVDRYNDCLADRECDEALAADARYNKARARLLLLQASPPAAEEPPGEDPDDKQKDERDPKKEEKGSKTGETELVPTKDKGKDERKEQSGDGGASGEGSPGQGRLPPVSDDKKAMPLAKGDAERHLEAAAKRILEEAAAHRRGKARPAAAGVKDW